MEFEDVASRYAAGRHVARQQEPVRLLVVADADMAECVHYAVVVEDVVGRNEICDQGGVGGHAALNSPVA